MLNQHWPCRLIYPIEITSIVVLFMNLICICHDDHKASWDTVADCITTGILGILLCIIHYISLLIFLSTNSNLKMLRLRQLAYLPPVIPPLNASFTRLKSAILTRSLSTFNDLHLQFKKTSVSTAPLMPMIKTHRCMGYVSHRYAIQPHIKKHRSSIRSQFTPRPAYIARNKRDTQVDKVRLAALARWLPAAKGNLKRRRAGLGHRIHTKSRRQNTRLKKNAYASRKQLSKLKKTLPPGSLPKRR